MCFSSKHLCFFACQPGLKLLSCYLLKNPPIRLWAVHKVVLLTDKENTLHVFYYEKMLKQDVVKVMKDEETLAFSLWKRKMIKPDQSLMGHTDQISNVTVFEGHGGGSRSGGGPRREALPVQQQCSFRSRGAGWGGRLGWGGAAGWGGVEQPQPARR